MWAMREPVVPGWAEEQTPTPFLCTKNNKTITKNKADSGVRQADKKMRMNNYFSRNDSRVILLLMFLFISIPILALNTSETRTINVTTAGKLPTLLPQNERGYVVNLTLTGKLNGTDFNILRAMATDQKLQVLDLSGANIVSGGESYYSNYGTDYYTNNNEFGYSLFKGCKKIQKVVLPNSLVTIGQSAFWYCTSLKTIVIGSKVTTIKSGLWGGCRQLTDVQIKNNNNFHLTNGILYNKDYTTIIAALQTWNYGDLTIRSGVKEIQYNAFAFCSKLTSISFPSSVTTIGDTAFEDTGITSVKFTSSITSIGSFAFSGCESLKQLDLTPLKVTSLDYGVFMTSKIEIVYLPKTLKELKQAVFSRTSLKHIFAYTATPATMYDLKTSSPSFENVDTKSCIVHVPQGKVNTYKSAAGWKDFLYISDSQEIEASTNEAYAVYTTDGTLTFYYDKQKSSRSGTKYELNTGANCPGWFNDHRKDIRKVIFNSSFVEARPTSTYCWFAQEYDEPILSEIIGIKNLNTSNVTDMSYMFSDCTTLKSLDVSGFKTSNVTSMRGMFNRCISLTSLDVSGFKTDKVTDMVFMFDNCSSLTSLDVSGFKNDKVTDMTYMFSGCTSLKSLDVSGFKTDNVTKMFCMFSDCSGLTSLDVSGFKTGNVTDMYGMFSGCSGLTSLDVSGFKTDNVTLMGFMFSNCSGLTSIDVSGFKTDKVKGMYRMFRGCSGLTSLDLSGFKTDNVTDMKGMFEYCSLLTTIYVGNDWNIDKVTYSGENMFLNCTSLVGGKGTKYDANHVGVTYAHIDGGPSNPGYLTGKNATSLMNLQEFIDANAGAAGVVDVDLSKFENDLVREQTLNVSTGARYRFINGTLTRHSSLKGPILYVSEGSEVQIETNVAIGGNFPYLGYSGNPVITLNHGKLFVRGTVTAGHTMATNVSSRSDVAIQMESDADDFRLLGGSIYGPIVSKAKGYIWLADGTINLQYGDNWSVSTYGNIELGSIADESILSPLNINLLERQSRVLLCSSLSANVSITNIQKQINDIIVAGYKESYDPRLGSVYTYLHAITEDDLQKVRFTGSSSFSLSLEGNAIYLRGSEDELPNSGCDEEWLQQKLDEIASKKPSEPVELTICEDGITLTKNIKVDKDCKVVLTGGPITSGTSIDYRYGREGLFMVYGELGFHDIKLTFDNDAKRDGSLGYFWSGGGKLELNKGTIASTTNGTFVGGLGELTITDAELYIGGDEMIISSDINTTISDYVCLVGQKTYCNGKIAIDGRTDPETGWEQYPIFRVGEVHVTSSLDLRAPKNSGMKIYLYKDASINTYEQGFIEMHISGEWDQMAVGGAFVTSESIGQYDYNKMTFMGMPIDRKAEFVPGSHQVRLMSTGQIDMQTNLSGLAYVSQTAPTTLYLSSDAVNTVYQSAEINHQDVSFNGMPNGATSRGRIHFTKDQILTINKDGRLTLTNIDITGEDGNERFDVSGKLVIAENVHVSDMSCFLRICSGGSLYASAELKTPIRILFENGPYSGNTIIAGTNGYQLTEADLSNVIVDGCELQIDRANNRIVVLSGMGIETINGNSKTMFKEGVFDLYGRKVVPARQGIYIMRESNVTKKIYVK